MLELIDVVIVNVLYCVRFGRDAAYAMLPAHVIRV
jgi:hypothetical protein